MVYFYQTFFLSYYKILKCNVLIFVYSPNDLFSIQLFVPWLWIFLIMSRKDFPYFYNYIIYNYNFWITLLVIISINAWPDVIIQYKMSVFLLVCMCLRVCLYECLYVASVRGLSIVAWKQTDFLNIQKACAHVYSILKDTTLKIVIPPSKKKSKQQFSLKKGKVDVWFKCFLFFLKLWISWMFFFKWTSFSLLY